MQIRVLLFGILKDLTGRASDCLNLPENATLADVLRHYEQTIPPAVTYGITDRMKDIEKVLTQLEALARKWNGEGAASGHSQPAQSAHM